MFGAERVIAFDRVLNACKWLKSKAEVLNYEEVDVGEALKEMTGGRGPCIDAVGMEAHGTGPMAFYDQVKAARLETDRPTALRQVIVVCGAYHFQVFMVAFGQGADGCCHEQGLNVQDGTDACP